MGFFFSLNRINSSQFRNVSQFVVFMTFCHILVLLVLKMLKNCRIFLTFEATSCSTKFEGLMIKIVAYRTHISILIQLFKKSLILISTIWYGKRLCVQGKSYFVIEVHNFLKEQFFFFG